MAIGCGSGLQTVAWRISGKKEGPSFSEEKEAKRLLFPARFHAWRTGRKAAEK
jgi:hypothetical protein